MICCRECATLLIDFVDNELDLETQLRVQQHLERCGPCAAYAASYRLTVQLPKRLPEKELPAAFVARLEQALAPHCEQRLANG
jgi:anti-sigma factor RsiW